MILEATKQLEIETIGEMEQGLTAGISEESMPFVFELVSKQLYSNPIGSVVREITSNCLDAHTEAGNTEDPVIVRFRNDPDEGMTIEFQDFGIGISPERVQSIYMNYFSSTKRGNNSQIGGFGIGSKTPLAYTSMFYITTIFNLMKYELIFHKGTTKPELESLNGWDYHQETRQRNVLDDNGNATGEVEPYIFKWKTPQGVPVEDKNGTTIKIPIENNIDKMKFANEIKFQLAYFDNVYFDNWGVTNNYKIYEGKHFKFRSDMDTDTPIHLCVGKVRYPIDTTKVRVDSIYSRIPVAVKFEVGELNITPSREALRYDDKGIKLIQERLSLAGEEIIEKFNSQNPEIEDLRGWKQSLNETPCIWFDKSAGHKLNLWAYNGISRNFKFKPLAGLNIKKVPKNLFFMWEAFATIERSGKRLELSTWGSSREVDNDFIIRGNYLIVKDTDRLSTYTDLKISQDTYSSIYLIRRKKLDANDAFKLLGLKTDEKDATTKVLGKAKTVAGYIRKITELVEGAGGKYYSDHRADDAWIAQYKRSIIESSAAWRRRAAQKIFYKTVPRFNGEEGTVANFQKRTGILVYGYKEDRQKLINIEALVTSNKQSYWSIKSTKKLDAYSRQKQAFQVIMIAKSVLTDIVGPKKTIYWEDFIKTGYFKKIYTAYLMNEKLKTAVYENSELRRRYLPNFSSDREVVEKTTAKHYNKTVHTFNSSSLKLCEDIVPIKSMMKIVDDFLAKYDFYIPLIGGVNTHLSPRDEASVVWFLKFEKIRLKNKYYLKSDDQLAQEHYDKCRAEMFKQRLEVIFRTINQPTIYLLTEKTTENGKDNNSDSTPISIEEAGQDPDSHIGGGEILKECDNRGMGGSKETDRILQQETIRDNEEKDSENLDTGESGSESERGKECSSSEGLETADQEGSEEREENEDSYRYDHF